jgi:hypothetical protein
MKNVFFILLFLPLLCFSQEENPANLYETMNITVKKGQEDAFEAAVKAHNASFHKADGEYSARLFYNINGPSGGQYTWVMGPTSYTAMDTRPGEGAHDEDWKKVDKHVESYGTPGYWSLSTKLSHMAEAKTPKRLIWMYDIKRGQGARWAELVGKVKQVYAEKRPTENFWVVWNDFANTKAGMDAVIIFPFEKWAWMDRQSKFYMDYEAVHGEGTWHHFLNQFNETINGRVDWMREIVD